jgi:CheY-like chemotaxis protein
MDVRMPVMDGLTAARQIRMLDRPDAKTVPIIAMTADAFAEDIQKCLDAGMNDHIAKPIDPQRLFQVLWG